MTALSRIIFVDDDDDDQYLVKRALAKITHNVELVCLRSGRIPLQLTNCGATSSPTSLLCTSAPPNLKQFSEFSRHLFLNV